MFIRLKQAFKIFKKSYFSRGRSRDPTNSEDGAIFNNSLRLKTVHECIVTRSSVLNVGRVPDLLLITMVQAFIYKKYFYKQLQAEIGKT